MKKIIICFFALLFIICGGINVSAVSTSAKAAILINADTGEVIFEKNADAHLPMASTTKIMTALLLCEKGDLQKEITVTAEMLRVEGSSMGLLAGDKVTNHDLLYGMMLASGNDAANVTAYTLGGTIDGFVKMMNSKAAELKLENTSFVTPSGLDADEHYSTARDMATLTRYALQNEEFANAVKTQRAVLNYGNPPYRRSLTNHNKLLKTFEGAIGVKTGFTKKSGRCLVSAAERDSKRVICVTLNDPNDWADHKQLLEHGLSAIRLTEIVPEKREYEIPVVSGTAENLKISIEPFVFSSLDDANISYNINLPQFVYAPISSGEIIGNVIYKKDDKVIKSVAIEAQEDIGVKQSQISYFDILKNNLKHIFLGVWEK